MKKIDELSNNLFEEPILWQFSPSKFRTCCHALKYASVFPMAFLLSGFIMALTDIIPWNVFFILFGGVTVLTFFIVGIALARQGRTIYTITETKIIVGYPAINYVSDFTNIKDIKKSRSLFKRNVGTIKFKVKKGINANYQFAKIDDVNSVYNLLISLWEKQNELYDKNIY